MDATGIANSYVAQTQQVLQSEMLKMSAQQDANLVALLQEGAENLQSAQAAPPPGLGGTVDITA